MGMSTTVVAFRPADEKWKKMKAVWDACTAAGVEKPTDVLKFFEYEPPEEGGVILNSAYLAKVGALEEWHNDNGKGYEVNLSKLPKDIKLIRFYNSW